MFNLRTNKQEKEKTEIQKQFGKRLAEIRTKQGFTQENLALDMGVDRTYISYIERGKRNPSLFMLFKLSKLLNVKLTELVNF